MKEKKKKSVLKKIILIFAVIIILLIITAIILIGKKFGKIRFKSINKDNLNINTELYSSVSDKVTQKEFDSISNILLIGTDSQNGYDKQVHSDSIMILSINRTKKSIKIISIPRDIAVDIPDFKRFKLNHSYAIGQETLLISLINSNFNLNLQEYITIDFAGIIDVINKLGGIEMDITYDEMNYINRGLRKMYQISDNNYSSVKKYGKVTLNGEQAMVHARNRTVGNDFTRSERHRDVLEAIINKLATMSIDKIWEISDYILDDVQTNIDIYKYLGILSAEIIHKDKYLSNITSTMVPSLEYSKGGMQDGAYLVETDIEKAKADFIKYMYEM